MNLAGLQVETLRTPAGLTQDNATSSARAAAVAELWGFKVLGRGSSRLGIAGPDETVVKVAHTALGLAMNLHEMATWETFPESYRQHLAPCLTLTPELILTQRRVEVIGPPGGVCADPAMDDAREEARRLFADRIKSCREELGLGGESELRLDNFGVLEGRVVAIDFGDQLPPLPSAWATLLGTDEPPTFRSLCERVGLNAENTEGCPCYCGGTWDVPGWFPYACLLDADLADVLAELTMTPQERLAA